MPQKILALSLLLGAALAPLCAQGAAPLVLKSVRVVLPDSTLMFPGAGADAINTDCLSCHSAEMVLNQPALTKAAWKAEVTKMINVYKAPVAAADVDPIVDYLYRTKGKD